MKIEQIDGQDDNWWSEINFSQLERNVRRLQGRIYSASKKGDKQRVYIKSLSPDLINPETVTWNEERVCGDAIMELSA